MVFTPQGYSLGGNLLGHHSNGNTGSFLDPDSADDGVVTSSQTSVPNPAPTANQPANQVTFVNLSALDTMTAVFSHELAEILTDPNNGGVSVTAPSTFSQNYPNQVESPGEIGDNEGEFYVGYENGTMVQSYWSRQGGDYIIPGGTAQKVAVNNGALSIKGDRLGVVNDTLTIDTTASGGVQETLDGETVQYAPGQVTQITIGLGGGSNTVQLNSLPPGVSISIDGSGGTTTVIAPNGPNSWQITGPGSGTLDGVVSFSSIQNLTGGTGTDGFQFQPAGSIPGNLDGGGGGDTLDDSALAGPITVNLQTDTAPGIGGTFSNISNLVGSQGSDTLVGADTPSVWTISGANSGSVNGVTFSSFENLTGGSAADTFAFQPGGSVAGTIDGGAGTNTLDYSAFPGDITVNLTVGTASAVGQGVTNIQDVYGSLGNDLIVGDTQPNVLVGGTGRNIIIGGAGADQVTGGGGDNILIAGTTSYDAVPAALSALMAEWSRTDRSFEKRIADLMTGNDGALNGPYTLTKKTVFDDDAPDTVTGGGGQTWFFVAQFDDTVNNRKPADHITRVK